MGVVVAFPAKTQSAETGTGEDSEREGGEPEIDPWTAIDVAIRDLRDIARRWGEPSALEQAEACRAMLERTYRDGD
ncbi:hypothetical protein [Bauldia sp.]|uniref:hypothetical protein n=1 Tax=Bauldia sp. TaxID=2575872 RepID=UPI003BAD6239